MPLCPSVQCRRTGRPGPGAAARPHCRWARHPARLLHCRTCSYRWKSARPDESALAATYAANSSDWWPDDGKARNHVTLRIGQILARRLPVEASVLDVGCFDSSMLAAVPGGWRRYGVEPSVSAAGRAVARGIEVLAPTLDQLAGDLQFDAILALDVIEHLYRPGPFFLALAARLRSGGVILLMSGDPAAWTWRVTGPADWYVANPEHVGFFDRAAMRHAARLARMQVAGWTRLQHYRRPLPQQLAEHAANLARLAARGLGGMGLPSVRRVTVNHRSPHWLGAFDHSLAEVTYRSKALEPLSTSAGRIPPGRSLIQTLPRADSR